jgi:AcrR family transcriptional regulator
VVHDLNVVHLSLVPDDRRTRARAKRRERLLAAAGRVIDRDCLAGLTMQAVADELDCAVGTVYTYVSSKAELVAALEEQAVAVLLSSYRQARAGWDAALAGEGLEAEALAVVQLQAFGAFLCAASVVFADEFHLQRQLLGERPPSATTGEGAPTMAVLARLVEPPRTLLDEAVALGVLQPADSFERSVRWLAALDGVLLLEALAPVDRHLFRAQHHGRALTADLLVGWGAARADVEVAASQVERLAALAPLAPPPP